MNKLVTDNPKNNFETTVNMVYNKNGWQYIRNGDKGIPTVDFCLILCKDHGCDISETITNGSQETKDEWLCDCVFNGCPIATVYAALSGFGHVRDRLKKYEDANILPPIKEEQKNE